MQDDPAFTRTPTGAPLARDPREPMPRGQVLRATEPVVAPVVTSPTSVDPVDDPVGTRYDPAARPMPLGVGGDPRPYAPRRRFSIGATFLGWAVASFFSLVFTALLLAGVGGIAADLGNDAEGLTAGDLSNLGIGTFIGLLAVMFVSYLIGGYAAGRIGHWDGAKHGAAVPVWTILFALLAVLIGTALVDGFNLAAFVGGLPVFDGGTLGTFGILGVVLMLLADFAGAILGGILGARGDQNYEGFGDAVTTRRTTRGRPL